MIDDKDVPVRGQAEPAEPFIQGISLPNLTLRESAITRSAPTLLLKIDAESVAMFRRRVESELEMLLLSERRPEPEEITKYLKARARFMKQPLCAALFKMGMLDSVLQGVRPNYGFDWIKQSLPVLEGHPLTRDIAAFYYREAACFAGKLGKWDECLRLARKGIKILPSDPARLLQSVELHRALATALFKLGRLKQSRRELDKVERLAKACGHAHGPSQWMRFYALKERVCSELGDSDAESSAKLLGTLMVVAAHTSDVTDREIELRIAWCAQERPEWPVDMESAGGVEAPG